LFVGEVGLILVFGVDYRFVDAPYIGPSLHLSFVDLPLRMLVPFLVSLLMLAVLQVFLGRTFIGRAILAVSQDRLALQLMAANPSRVKRIAFGFSIATASVAGALLIIIQPVEPSIGRDYIGRIFAICVLGGLASDPRTDQLRITREGAVAVFEAAKSPTVTGMSRPVLRVAIFVVYGTLEPQIAVLMTPVP
jgi:branched-chain amino acid transport system permease protein